MLKISLLKTCIFETRRLWGLGVGVIYSFCVAVDTKKKKKITYIALEEYTFCIFRDQNFTGTVKRGTTTVRGYSYFAFRPLLSNKCRFAFDYRTANAARIGKKGKLKRKNGKKIAILRTRTEPNEFCRLKQRNRVKTTGPSRIRTGRVLTVR